MTISTVTYLQAHQTMDLLQIYFGVCKQAGRIHILHLLKSRWLQYVQYTNYLEDNEGEEEGM